MTRLNRFAFTAVLALGLGGAAPAQYPNAMMRPGGYGFNPYAAPNYSFGYNYSFGFNYTNPITGTRTVYQTYQSYSSPSPYGNIPIPGITLAGAGFYFPGGGFTPGIGARNPYLGNGFGGAAFAQPSALAVQQAAQVRAQAGPARGGPANPPAGIAPKADPKVAEAPRKPAELVALPEPTPDSINKLLADIAKLDAEGAKADAPLLPPELLGSLQYAPPVAQAALSMLQQPDPLEVPQQLEGPARLETRKALLAAAKPVLELVRAGKSPDKDAVAGLRAATAAARKELAADAEQPDAFFARLDALADAASNPDYAGINDGRLQSTGMTALEFSRYVEKYKLKVADAPPGSEAAYRSLTRGLAGYRQELAAK